MRQFRAGAFTNPDARSGDRRSTCSRRPPSSRTSSAPTTSSSGPARTATTTRSRPTTRRLWDLRSRGCGRRPSRIRTCRSRSSTSRRSRASTWSSATPRGRCSRSRRWACERRRPARLRSFALRRGDAGRRRRAAASRADGCRHRPERQLPRLGRRPGRRLRAPDRDARVPPHASPDRLGQALAARPVPVPRGPGRGRPREHPDAAGLHRLLDRIDQDALTVARERQDALAAQRIVQDLLLGALADRGDDVAREELPAGSTGSCRATERSACSRMRHVDPAATWR